MAYCKGKLKIDENDKINMKKYENMKKERKSLFVWKFLWIKFNLFASVCVCAYSCGVRRAAFPHLLFHETSFSSFSSCFFEHLKEQLFLEELLGLSLNCATATQNSFSFGFSFHFFPQLFHHAWWPHLPSCIHPAFLHHGGQQLCNALFSFCGDSLLLSLVSLSLWAFSLASVSLAASLVTSP